MTNILTGTVSVTNGSPNFTWVGTALTAATTPGDSGITIAGVQYFILSITDTTHGVLTRNYTGSTAGGVVAEINPYTLQQVNTATLNTRVTDYLAKLTSLDAYGRGLKYTYVAGTALADPGPGNIAFNNSTLTAATGVAIDNLDATNLDVSAVLDSWDDSTSSPKATLWIRSIASQAFLAFNIINPVVNASGYRTSIGLTLVDSDGTIAVGEPVMVWAERNGNQPIPGFISVADAVAANIDVSVKQVRTQYYNPTYTNYATLSGGARYARTSLADITAGGYPALSYFRSIDRFMPDGTTDATNGGYWLLAERRVVPQMFGALAQTDDTTALQAFLNFLGNGVRGSIELNHTISTTLQMNSKSNFTLDGNGSLKVANGTTGSNHGGILFQLCTNFTVRDITIDGNRANRAPLNPAGDGCHLFNFNRCSYFEAYDLSALNSTCDGYYIASSTPNTKSSHSHHFTFDNCLADNAYRNGISVIEANNAYIVSCKFNNSNGTLPQAGMDLEPNPGTISFAIEDIWIVDCEFNGNTGWGAVASSVSNPRNIHFIRPHLTNNVLGAIQWWCVGGEITDAFIDGATNSIALGVIEVRDGGDLDIVRPKFRNMTYTTASIYLINIISSVDYPVRVIGLDVDTSVSVIALGAPDCSFDDAIIRGTTTAYAIVVNAARCKVRRNYITAHTLAVIRTNAADTVIADNTLIEQASNDSTGNIFASSSSSGVKIERNRISRAASAAGTGIIISATYRSLIGNVVEGFTGFPFNFSGAGASETVGIYEDNVGNGARVNATTYGTSLTRAAAAAAARTLLGSTAVGDALFVAANAAAAITTLGLGSTGATDRALLLASGTGGGTIQSDVDATIDATNSLTINNITGEVATLSYFSSVANRGDIQVKRTNGTPGSPTAVQLGNTICGIAGLGYDGGAMSTGNRGSFNLKAAENWSNTNQGTRATVEVTPTASTTRREVWSLEANGDMLIPQGNLSVTGGYVRPKSYTVATVPAASSVSGAQIYVSNESGGAVPAFSDGTNWRRVTDRAIVS